VNYYIIIPAHNEQAFLEDALQSIVKQTVLPKKVMVVNDHSTDDTAAIIRKYSDQYPYFRGINILSSDQHMPGSKVVAAFNKGLSALDENYDFIVKLDADVVLPENYFEKIISIFKSSGTIGIAGGFAYEKNSEGEWELNHPMNTDHVRGAFKSYSKACFKAIGQLKTAMGWDTVDELLAQYHQFDIFTDASLKVKHQRPIGKAYNKRARFLQGKAMYTMRYGFVITLIASVKMATKQGKFQTVIDNLKGFFTAKKEQVPYLVTSEEGKFIRQLRWRNIRQKLF
jgi:glycosyltransferase involved in cell wall biosynthesis